MSIKYTKLWEKAFKVQENDPFNGARDKLRSAHEDFWKNATVLSNEIQKSLPHLTLHNEQHFEALWRCADLIAGERLELTPVETFIFGGAVLIHDAANSIAAFDGGIDEISNTPEWSDAVASYEARYSDEEDSSDNDKKQQTILLETLRHLHAVKAESLCGMHVKVGSETFYLLQDDLLRSHFGNVIGQVAASHHWDIEDIPRRMQSRIGAPSGFPNEWIVRPVLIACLIRCADAIQLDQSRAPDFLYGLLKLEGISELHWRAQNRIAAPMPDPDDTSAILFTSTKPYLEADSDAWWIAYDAINMASNELSNSNALLKDVNLPSFAINRVSHANSPERMAHHIRVDGWEPVRAKLQVSNVGRMVDMFGGEQLYGHKPYVALRELIQNAADAVRLRRGLDASSSSYRGQITVTLEPINNEENDVWLHVDDDGIGMSQDVLVGPLLDFGSSYLSSALVKSERPGLVGQKLRRAGKYGIGFFATFMLGDYVEVTSKPFDTGLNSAKTLVFRNGYKHRPILQSKIPKNFGANNSTRVSVKLSSKKFSELLSHRDMYDSGVEAPLDKLVSALCPMLDVDIFVEKDGDRKHAHDQNWETQDPEVWLNSITLPSEVVGVRGENIEEKRKSALEFAAKNLELIDPNNPFLGRACISLGLTIGAKTVGGLVAHHAFQNPNENFVGAIEYHPSGPIRSARNSIAGDKLALWATRQAKSLATQNLSDQEKFRVAVRVTQFGGDAEPVAVMNLNRKPSTLQDIYKHLLKGNIIFAPIKMPREQTPPMITHVRENHTGLIDNYHTNELEFLVDTLESMHDGSDADVYCAVPAEGFDVKLGFVTLLNKYASENGKYIEGEFVLGVEFAKYIGEASPRQGLVKGKIIKTNGLKLLIKN
ncbi:HD domain-containing protein [Kordiimonas pumila]|uniref:ATP-binding protein n=1 Tax=Kordiimonas pumila TaxID=2161677 RepID=A0ABV7D2N7_9PROT|nr:ATP-binding protein [Kordiimonas pumila]